MCLAAVVLAGSFTVEERRVHRDVIGGVVQLRREAQQHLSVIDFIQRSGIQQYTAKEYLMWKIISYVLGA